MTSLVYEKLGQEHISLPLSLALALRTIKLEFMNNRLIFKFTKNATELKKKFSN